MRKLKCRLTYLRLATSRRDTVGVLTLDRPEMSNALDPEMISHLISYLDQVSQEPDCRALVLRGAGINFCAGGDLDRMRDSARLTKRENREDSENFHKLFQKLSDLPLPTVALAHGAAYGGGVGLVAACDWAIATTTARFCLSELRLGLVAAPILEAVAKKISVGNLRRFVMTGTVFGPDEARSAGLVQRLAEPSEIDAALREDLNGILRGAPTAQRRFKTLHKYVVENPQAHRSSAFRKKLVEELAAVRIATEGQEGMTAFLEKRPPRWQITLPHDWKLAED